MRQRGESLRERRPGRSPSNARIEGDKGIHEMGRPFLAAMPAGHGGQLYLLFLIVISGTPY
jgi:hypothetical protein